MSQTVVYEQQPQVVTAPGPAQIVEKAYQGPPGAIGATGPTGPQGNPGSAPQAYEYPQPTPAAVWTITHNLGYKPAGVRVEDSAGTDIEGEIEYIDNNTIQLTFSAAFSGTAFLS